MYNVEAYNVSTVNCRMSKYCRMHKYHNGQTIIYLFRNTKWRVMTEHGQCIYLDVCLTQNGVLSEGLYKTYYQQLLL